MTKEEAQARSEFSRKLLIFDDYYAYCKHSWGRVWVEAEKPIPESLRSSFYEELCSPNEVYRKELEESVRWFGVRWSK